jgi:hypothetical protein
MVRERREGVKERRREGEKEGRREERGREGGWGRVMTMSRRLSIISLIQQEQDQYDLCYFRSWRERGKEGRRREEEEEGVTIFFQMMSIM